MKTKKTTMRKCVGCHNLKSKDELIRIVKDKENKVFVDESGRSNGRGAYICKNIDCFEKSIKNSELERSLKCRIDEVVLNELKNMIF